MDFDGYTPDDVRLMLLFAENKPASEMDADFICDAIEYLLEHREQGSGVIANEDVQRGYDDFIRRYGERLKS